MFDIWPEHKDVLVGTDAVERLNAITDRGVNILLVPDGPPAPREIPAAAASLGRAGLSKPAMRIRPQVRSPIPT